MQRLAGFSVARRQWRRCAFVFFLAACAGWAYEALLYLLDGKGWGNRGFLYGPYLPIYGFGAVMMLLALQALAEQPDLVFLLGAVLSGAVSSLLGAMGNHLDYAPYLAQLGAADARDDIFAASCYCPITNLDHADMAYEWMYNGENTYHMARRVVENGEERFVPFAEQMSQEQIALSDLAKPQFPTYLNSLGLKDERGNVLTLDEAGEGSFKALVERCVIASAQEARAAGEDLSGIDWLKYEGDAISAIDFPAYVRYITRMKPVLAFDGQSMTTPENDLFDNATVNCRHFTAFSREHSAQKDMAEAQVIRMMNPMNYIGSGESTVAPHWRIRHGEADRDTSLAVPVMLATKLRNAGYPVDFKLPWNVPHSGDYDLEALFAWIDGLVRNS